jgi:hypothetical protein
MTTVGHGLFGGEQNVDKSGCPVDILSESNLIGGALFRDSPTGAFPRPKSSLNN